MIYHDGDFFIYDSEGNLRADVLTKENLSELDALLFGVEVLCYPGTKMLIPSASDPYIDPSEDVSLKGFYSVFKAAEKQKDLFMKSNKRIREEDAPILFEIARNIEQRTELMPIYSDISGYLADDDAAQQAYSEQKAISELEYVCPNDTLFQKSPEDKLHIRLPDDSYIVSNDAKIPDMTSVSRPYRSPLYKMYGIDRIMNASDALRKDTVADVLGVYKEAGYVYDLDEVYSSFYMEERTFIFGDSDNNLLEIQPHEQDYYHNLLAFIRHHIYLFNRESMTGATRDELKERNQSDFDTCNIPSRLEKYFYDLLTAITEHYYSHTGQTTFSDEGNEASADDDDSGESSSKKTKFPAVGFVSTKVQMEGANAVDALHGYIQLSGKYLGAGVWAEAIVKLLRWGKFKPTSLYVGENNPNEIDLMNFRVKTVNVNLADMEKIVYENGRSYFIESKITVPYIQKKVGYEIDAIFTVVENHKLKDGSIYSQRSLITVQDLIREYVSGNHFIDGIDFDGYQFFCDINEDTVASIKNTLSSHAIETYRPSYLLDIGINLDITKIEGMAYALVYRSSLADYRPDDDDFAAHIAKYPKSERAYALYGCWIKAFDDACSDIKSDDLEDYINMYYTDIYPKFMQQCISIDKSADKVFELKGSSYFVGLQEAVTPNEEEDFFEDDEEDLDNMYPITQKDISTLTFNRLYRMPIKRNKANNTINLAGNDLIGGYHVDTVNKIITFASLNDGVQINQQGGKLMSYQEALPYLMGGVLKATRAGKDVVNMAEFASVTTAVDLYNAVKLD